MNHFYFIALSTILFLQPCATLSMNSKKQTEVSLECAIAIEKINKDVPRLYYFLNGSWNGCGNQKNMVKPSELVNFFINSPDTINKSTKCEYAPATWYLEKFIKPLYPQLDLALEKKATESNNKKAFKWFDKYFQQNALINPITAYKKELVKTSKERIELSKKGIFFSDDGKTIVIDPSTKNNSDI